MTEDVDISNNSESTSSSDNKAKGKGKKVRSRKGKKKEDKLILDPSRVRKRLAKALSSEESESEREGEWIDIEEDEFSKSIEEVLSTEPEKSEDEDVLDLLEEMKSEMDKFDIDEGMREIEVDSIDDLFEGLEESEKDEESEEPKPEHEESEVAERPEIEISLEDSKPESDEVSEEDDGVDYTFEGYEEPEDPEILAELSEGEDKAILKEYEQLEGWLKSLEGAIPISVLYGSANNELSEEQREVIEREFEGIYICHEFHLRPIHPPIEDGDHLELIRDYIPDSMNIYEVVGLGGFWQFTGVASPDLNSALQLTMMLRFVPSNSRFPDLFRFGELVLVLRRDGFHVLAKMNTNPFVFIQAGRKFI